MMMNDALSSAGLPPDAPAFWIALALMAVAGLLAWRWRRAAAQAERLRADLERARIDLAGTEARAKETDTLRAERDEERLARQSVEAQLAAREATLAERERTLGETRARLDAELKAATAQMLDGAHKAFYARTKETFDRFRENADAEGERRRKALDDLLRPVSETLVRYEKGLTEMREEQKKSRGEPASHIVQLA